MLFTTRNWIAPLRDDILKRGSLYPETEPIVGINANNWLLFLQEDIVNRGSLYPGSAQMYLDESNFLIKLRDEIIKNNSLYPDLGPSPYLTSLVISNVGLTPSFDSNIFVYTGGSAVSTQTSMTITHDPEFTEVCYFNNTRYSPGATVNFVPGLNTFRAEISNNNGAMVAYVVTIAYTPPSTYLDAFNISDTILNPSFESGVLNYTGSTSTISGELTLNTESPTGICTAQLNGSPVPLSGIGPFTGTLNFESGMNTLIVEVSNGSAPKTIYSVQITQS